MRAIMTVVDRAKLIEYTLVQDYFNGVTGYPLTIPGCSTVLRVDKVWLSGTEIEFEVVNKEWLEIGLRHLGDIEGGLKTQLYAGISKDSCEIPTYIYERYGDVIINRALSTLYGMNDEDWFDAELVKFYGGIAKGGVDAIKQDTLEQEAPDGIPIDASHGLIV